MANNKLDEWAKDCRKAMIERDNMKVSELAEAIGCTIICFKEFSYGQLHRKKEKVKLSA